MYIINLKFKLLKLDNCRRKTKVLKAIIVASGMLVNPYFELSLYKF